MPECSIVLLMNLDAMGASRGESVPKTISEIIRGAWLTLTRSEHNGATSIVPIILNRAGSDDFSTLFNQLRTQIQTMAATIATGRTSITG